MGRKIKHLWALFKPEALQSRAGQEKYDRGLKYYQEGRVLCVRKKEGMNVEAEVQGDKKYRVSLLRKDSTATFDASCTCPSFENDGFCKHCVAAAVAYSTDGEYETLSATYVRKLLSAIRRASKDAKENPGISLADVEKNLEIGKTVKTESGLKYITTNKGIVSWGHKPVDKLLEGFDLLSIKKGFQIDGYYNYDGMGGNFSPVAFSAGKMLPDWEDVRGNPFFQLELLPSGLDTNIEKYIIPTGTPESFFQKTLFVQEVYNIGAYWHGCSNWHLGGIVLEHKEQERRVQKQGDTVIKKGHVPMFINPKISMGKDGKKLVSFYYFSEGIGSTRGLFKYEYTHLPDGTVDRTDARCIIDMGMGPIP